MRKWINYFILFINICNKLNERISWVFDGFIALLKIFTNRNQSKFSERKIMTCPF